MKEFLEQNSFSWVYPTIDSKWCDSIVNEFNIHPATAQVLVSRNFSNFKNIYNFLYSKLPDLHSPESILYMDKAIKRIMLAYKKKENILVYGDNDVDGITGTALLVEFLQKLKCKTFFYVPNRITSNPSLITDATNFAFVNKCTLLITVDCGITAVNEIKEIQKQNIDVIITDHHEPTSEIPECIAPLNPKLNASTYPNRELTGVGVVFKLVHALTNHMISEGTINSTDIDLKRYLDLVALGTIADMGTLVEENRTLVRYGLKQFGQTKRKGLIELMKVSEVNCSKISTLDIASKIAPRLNSLGRIANPEKGVELLLTHDNENALRLAKELDSNNMQRQKIERKDFENIEDYIKKNIHILSKKALVLHSKDWHPGIIPIIAARISKKYNRPVLIIALENGIGKGSIRTIPEFPLLPSLRRCSKELVSFGGHNYAAGLTIKEENIAKFTELFIRLANESLNQEDIQPKIFLDGPLKFEDLTFEFLDSMHLLEPHGTGNHAPIFYTDVVQYWPPKVVGKKHLKLYLEQNDRILEGVGFGLSDQKNKLNKKNLKLRIAYTPHVNIFLKKSSIQLLIKDFKIL